MTESQWHSVRAPGRVNLIGEHTDYQDGWCLPIAIELGTTVRFRAATSGITTITSDRLEGTVRISLDDTDDRDRPAGQPTTYNHDQPKWGAAATALVVALQERGHRIDNIEAEVISDVPLGSGLSSSASFLVALAMAFTYRHNNPSAALGGVELARTAQRAEHINGVPCGIMDQMASVFGRDGHAVLIDCRSTETQLVPVPSALEIIVIHSGLPRRLADSQYAQRRQACATACERLGIRALRDATPSQVRNDPFARHVVSENARVHAFVAAMHANDYETLGAILNTSHQSLAVDFSVSTPELDTLCAILNECGAYGARLTGAGFGGCVVALAPTADADAVAAESAQRYRAATLLNPLVFTTRASRGAAFIHPQEQP